MLKDLGLGTYGLGLEGPALALALRPRPPDFGLDYITVLDIHILKSDDVF